MDSTFSNHLQGLSSFGGWQCADISLVMELKALLFKQQPLDEQDYSFYRIYKIELETSGHLMMKFSVGYLVQNVCSVQVVATKWRRADGCSPLSFYL